MSSNEVTFNSENEYNDYVDHLKSIKESLYRYILHTVKDPVIISDGKYHKYVQTFIVNIDYDDIYYAYMYTYDIERIDNNTFMFGDDTRICFLSIADTAKYQFEHYQFGRSLTDTVRLTANVGDEISDETFTLIRYYHKIGIKILAKDNTQPIFMVGDNLYTLDDIASWDTKTRVIKMACKMVIT